MRNKCPYCEHLLISPNGKADAKILLVGDYPGYEDIRVGLPFVGDVGNILRYELGRAGMPIETCRVTNLWLHQKPEGKNINRDCFLYGFSQLLVELKSERDGVLFMGSDLAEVFGVRLSDYVGIPITKYSQYQIPALDGVKAKCIMFAYNPAHVFHSGVGEFRLSLEKFKKAVKDDKVV